MSTTVSQAVATVDNSPAGLLQTYKGDFAQVLPAHLKPDVFVRLATGALRRDPKLAEAAQNNVAAFLGAILDAARLGHEPGTDAYYLVPRKRKGQLEIQGIEGYQGIVERIFRAGAVASVVVETVHEADRFEWSPGTMQKPDHHVDWFGADRGPLVGVYAYCVMTSGATSKVVVLNRAQVMALKAKSEGATSDYSPWKTNEEAMWLKSAARQLRKWVPTSASYREEVARASAAASDVTVARDLPALPPHDPDTGEVIDAELVDLPAHGYAYDPAADDGTCSICGGPEDADPHMSGATS